MGKQVIDKLLPVLDKMKWPSLTVGTEQGRQIYLQAWDRIEDYQGDPNQLTAVLRLLQTADSHPYATAGAAYMLVAAAREKDGTYAPAGLSAAMQWLEAAQEMEPDVPEINVIEAFIYVYSSRLDDARLILDYLHGQSPDNYYLQLGEIAYWTAVGNMEQAVQWFNEAAETALVVPQRLRLRARLADYYLENEMHQPASEVYKEALYFDKENALLWHKLSITYWRLENYEEAEHANRRALQLKEFPAARKMEEALKKKNEGGEKGMFGRLFGRS